MFKDFQSLLRSPPIWQGARGSWSIHVGVRVRVLGFAGALRRRSFEEELGF